jgi:serine/threonine protein kinase
MIDQGKKKNQFFNIQDGYKIIRSKDSRLVHMSKSSVSLPQVLFRGKGLEEFNTQEIEKLLSPEEKSFLDLVRRCLEIDPYKRISCEEAIRHDFFKEDLIREEELMEKEMM